LMEYRSADTRASQGGNVPSGEVGKTEATKDGENNNLMPMLGMAAIKLHHDVGVNGEVLQHVTTNAGKFRFNNAGQIVKHSGEVIRNAKGKAEMKAITEVAKRRPNFFLRNLGGKVGKAISVADKFLGRTMLILIVIPPEYQYQMQMQQQLKEGT